MTKVELITEIRQRFRFSAQDLRRGLPEFEVELIYKVFPKLPKHFIDITLEEFKTGKLKANKTRPITTGIQKEPRGRGVIQARVLIG